MTTPTTPLSDFAAAVVTAYRLGLDGTPGDFTVALPGFDPGMLPEVKGLLEAARALGAQAAEGIPAAQGGANTPPSAAQAKADPPRRVGFAPPTDGRAPR